ncbi:MAG: endonuclease/exonuclease/phosphatase family protein, partial [Cetobacterium sp.]
KLLEKWTTAFKKKVIQQCKKLPTTRDIEELLQAAESPDDSEEVEFGKVFKINNFDLTYVLIHSIYGKKVSQRQFEANKTLDIYNYFQNLDPTENDILIGGDFNLAANDSAFENLLNHKDNIIYSLDPSIKTTIGTKGFANSYDNIFLSKKFTTEFKGKSGALDITRDDYIKTRKEVSDHLPIFIIVDTEIDDD